MSHESCTVPVGAPNGRKKTRRKEQAMQKREKILRKKNGVNKGKENLGGRMRKKVV